MRRRIIGRLPWKTFGLPDLRDGSGERLWYALSPNFRDNPSVSPLNSDTRGSITVYRRRWHDKAHYPGGGGDFRAGGRAR